MSDNPIKKITSEDIEALKNQTVYSIPDNPSNKGFSAAQIKGKIADPILIIARWLKRLAEQVYDEFNNKQDKLVSGVNIKTLNGESLLGSGDIEIEGGISVPVFETTAYLNLETDRIDNVVFKNTSELNDVTEKKYPIVMLNITQIVAHQSGEEPMIFDVDLNLQFVLESDLKNEDENLFALTYIKSNEDEDEDTHEKYLSVIHFSVVRDLQKTQDAAILDCNEMLIYESAHGDFVEKTNTSNIVYGNDGNGDQTSYEIDHGTGVDGAVARRRTSGALVVPVEPQNDNEATSKQYVDGLVNSLAQNSYTLVNTDTYPTLNDFLQSTGSEGTIYLYPIDTSDTSKGYYQYIWELYNWLSLGTTQIDLTNYVTLNTAQQITGVKTFENGIVINNSANWKLEIGQYQPSLVFKKSGTAIYTMSDLAFFPATSNAKNLGASNAKWNNLYIAGSIYDNNGNSATVSDIISAASGNNITITTTTGSESISDGTNTLNVATRNTAQEISGAKVFKGNDLLRVSNTGWVNAWYFNYNARKLELKEGAENNPTTHYVFDRATGFYPATTNAKDLGGSTNLWKDLYVAGNLSDSVNSISIQNIEDKTNKVTSMSSASTDTQYPSAKAVYDAIQEVAATADGACKRYCLSYHTAEITQSTFIANRYKRADGTTIATWADFQTYILFSENFGDPIYLPCQNAAFNANSSSIMPVGYIVTTDNYVLIIGTSEQIRNGDIIWVVEIDVPDRWCYNQTFYVLETSKVTNYVTTNTAQIITEPKSFYNNMFNNTLPLRIQGFANKTWGLEMDKDFGRLHFKFADANGTSISNVADHFVLDSSALFPATTNTKDLGTSTYCWKDLYLDNALKITSANNTFELTNAGYYITLKEGSTVLATWGSGGMASATNIYPNTTGKDLGQTANKWQNLYLYGGTFFSYTGQSRTWELKEDEWGTLVAASSNDGTNYQTYFSFQTGCFVPTTSTIDLGTNNASQKWRNIYLSGNLSDGTNQVSVAEIAKKTDIPTNQMSMAIVANALTNINGWNLSAYEATLGTTNTYVTYTITYGGAVLTQAQAAAYMRAMTGSDFVPTYNYNIPQNTYLMFADKTIWKPQYDAINGLILYKMADMTSVSDYGIATEQEVLAILQGGNQ